MGGISETWIKKIFAENGKYIKRPSFQMKNPRWKKKLSHSWIILTKLHLTSRQRQEPAEGKIWQIQVSQRGPGAGCRCLRFLLCHWASVTSPFQSPWRQTGQRPQTARFSSCPIPHCTLPGRSWCSSGTGTVEGQRGFKSEPAAQIVWRAQIISLVASFTYSCRVPQIGPRYSCFFYPDCSWIFNTVQQYSTNIRVHHISKIQKTVFIGIMRAATVFIFEMGQWEGVRRG